MYSRHRLADRHQPRRRLLVPRGAAIVGVASSLYTPARERALLPTAALLSAAAVLERAVDVDVLAADACSRVVRPPFYYSIERL
jgi:hypothetical protein